MDELAADFTLDDVHELRELLELEEETDHPAFFDAFLIVILCSMAALLILLLVPYAYVRSTRKR